jgi:cell division septal protein FtsQ
MSTASIALPARTRARIRVLRRRLVVFLLLAAGLFALYTLWFRDSSLVAVKTVRVDGTGSGAIDRRLDKALTDAGLEMTTLHVRQSVLADAARPFPLVESVSVDPTLPSTLNVHVTKRRPAGLIGEGSETVAVAGDGTILRGLPADHLDLPQLPLSSPPKGRTLRGPMLQQAEILGEAPKALLRHVEHSFAADSGVGVQLEGGVDLVFGDAARAADKWHAAAAVLSDPDLGPLDYVDLSVAGRPAVGGAGYSPPPISSG